VALSSWTVSNQGHTASGSFTNGFYLSTNALITTMDVNLSDNTNTSLSPDTHFEWGGVTLVIPESTELGTYYIGILLDRTNAVTESDESNNYVRSKITVVESLDE
jgi:subtilase family serine protease